MTIFAIAIASNFQQFQNIQIALTTLTQLGQCKFSDIYEIPCRDGIGADYWNGACLMQANIALEQMFEILKGLEQQSGRKRPGHQISLDVDLIAWGENLDSMQFNTKKLPLADDVVIPLAELWSSAQFVIPEHQFPKVKFTHALHVI